MTLRFKRLTVCVLLGLFVLGGCSLKDKSLTTKPINLSSPPQKSNTVRKSKQVKSKKTSRVALHRNHKNKRLKKKSTLVNNSQELHPVLVPAESQARNWRPFMMVSVGPVLMRPEEQTQVVNVMMGQQIISSHTFTTSILPEGGASGQVLVGIEVPQNAKWSWQIGLGLSRLTPFTQNGSYIQTGPGVEEIGDYQYQLNNSRFFIENKLLGTWPRTSIHPYLTIDTGVSYNQFSDFEINDDQPPIIREPFMSDHSQFSFTYGVGTGLDWDLDKYYRVGVGYRFTDLGGGSFGKDSRFPMDQGFTQNHFFAHEILFSLTYLK